MKYTIYSITCKINNKVYYGRSQELEKRWRAHKNMLRTNTHNNYYLQEDWNTYGEENFLFQLLYEYDNLEQSITHEQELIESNLLLKGYNIGSSVSGGNLFTNNPRKEQIRESKRRQMSGKGNHQYGRPKTQKMIDSVKKANSKKVSVEGQEFNSVTEAAKHFNKKPNTVSYRLKSKSFPDWKYV